MVATEWKFHQESLTDELNGTLVDLLVVIIKSYKASPPAGFMSHQALPALTGGPSFSANTATFMETCIHNW